MSDRRGPPITPTLVLQAYAHGLFPMAQGRDDPDIRWYEPERRGIIPLDRFHVPRRLARRLRSGSFEVRVDSAFAAVIRACAAPAPGRDDSWINPGIIALFTALHEMGFAHSVECWRERSLVGGLYGVALGGAFFGESMFSRASDASKVALVHLVDRLRRGGFTLLDTQFVTAHLETFGAIEIPRDRYRALLARALATTADFGRADQSVEGVPGEGELGAGGSARQSTTQIS